MLNKTPNAVYWLDGSRVSVLAVKCVLSLNWPSPPSFGFFSVCCFHLRGRKGQDRRGTTRLESNPPPPILNSAAKLVWMNCFESDVWEEKKNKTWLRYDHPLLSHRPDWAWKRYKMLRQIRNKDPGGGEVIHLLGVILKGRVSKFSCAVLWVWTYAWNTPKVAAKQEPSEAH